VGWALLSATVRPLTETDLNRVSEIFAWYALNSVATFAEDPRSDQEWRNLRAALAGRGLPFLIAEADDDILGYAYAAPWRSRPAYRHTVEDSVFVAPGLTGQGIGRRLLTDLVAASTAAGARQMIAVIADTNDDASVRLHAACGFHRAGRLSAVGYKHGQWIDTLLMQRSLT
jgi:L-amino acid N-acyltransferase YncA